MLSSFGVAKWIPNPTVSLGVQVTVSWLQHCSPDMSWGDVMRRGVWLHLSAFAQILGSILQADSSVQVPFHPKGCPSRHVERLVHDTRPALIEHIDKCGMRDVHATGLQDGT